MRAGSGAGRPPPRPQFAFHEAWVIALFLVLFWHLQEPSGGLPDNQASPVLSTVRFEPTTTMCHVRTPTSRHGSGLRIHGCWMGAKPLRSVLPVLACSPRLPGDRIDNLDFHGPAPHMERPRERPPTTLAGLASRAVALPGAHSQKIAPFLTRTLSEALFCLRLFVSCCPLKKYREQCSLKFAQVLSWAAVASSCGGHSTFKR